MSTGATEIRAASRAAARKEAGFTLVDLLATLAIILAMSMIAIPAYNGYIAKAQFSEVVTATRPTQAAIETCAEDGQCLFNGGISLAVASQAAPTTQGTLGFEYQMALGVADFGFGFYPLSFAENMAQEEASTYSGAGATYEQAPFAPPGYYCPVFLGFCAEPPMPLSAMAPYAADYPGAAPSQLEPLPCIGTAPCAPSTKYAMSVSYDANGYVYATATQNGQLRGETYTLAPQFSGGSVDWVVTGSCKTRPGGAIC
jgi:type IV pilus assembly protein PilA